MTPLDLLSLLGHVVELLLLILGCAAVALAVVK